MATGRFEIPTLGPRTVNSPLRFAPSTESTRSHFIDDRARILADIRVQADDADLPAVAESFEEAGPREKIFFTPNQMTAAIVTCGGLSPGLNNVIRSSFDELVKNYGVARVLGIRNGFLGMVDPSRPPMDLTAQTRDVMAMVDDLGGTILGSSRGPQDPVAMVDFLRRESVSIIFCIGGDGTQRGAEALHTEIQRQGLPISVIGIPKTIDNDIPFVDQSFGYATALETAAEVIRSAYVEARDAVNGVGLVKLMGRHAGFIAAGASVIHQEVDFTLVPEVPFPLSGPDGFLDALEKRMREQNRAVVVVAEGAGQHLFPADPGLDVSGNKKLNDIGLFLKQEIPAYLSQQGMKITLKYLDPSYHIRSLPANAYDRYLSDRMARHAVHAGMAGKTGMVVGYRNGRIVYVPIRTVVAEKKTLPVNGDLWRAVLQVTGQPRW